jgi:hypothetical protein
MLITITLIVPSTSESMALFGISNYVNSMSLTSLLNLIIFSGVGGILCKM